jgi:DNA-binding response OmpR family regulator
MVARAEVLVCGCREDDLAVLRTAAGPDGPLLHAVDSPVKVAHEAMADRPAAIVLGVGPDTLANLDVIPVIRAIRSDLPVIVVAADDSLELERTARQRGIFYYLVHPVEKSEARAVLRNVLRSRCR